jgi:hypothetical protein
MEPRSLKFGVANGIFHSTDPNSDECERRFPVALQLPEYSFQEKEVRIVKSL